MLSIFSFFQIINFNDKLFFNFSILLLLLFFLLDKKIKKEIFLVFYTLFAYSVILGLVVYFLILFGAELYWSKLEPSQYLKAINGHYYRNYIVTVVLDHQIFSTAIGEVFRFSAIYDEPGRVGTLAALLLAATNFDMKEWKGKTILLAGILSFSLAFLLLAFLFLILKQTKYLFLSMIVILIIGGSFFSELKENVLLEKFVFKRVELVIFNPEKVNNRVNDTFNELYNDFLNSDKLLFGTGIRSNELLKSGVSTYKTIIYDYGIIGFILIISIYLIILVMFTSQFKEIIYLIPFNIVFFASIFQRPDVFEFWMFLIYTGSILYAKENKYNLSLNKV
jgi:hypothetical protein